MNSKEPTDGKRWLLIPFILGGMVFISIFSSIIFSLFDLIHYPGSTDKTPLEWIIYSGLQAPLQEEVIFRYIGLGILSCLIMALLYPVAKFIAHLREKLISNLYSWRYCVQILTVGSAFPSAFPLPDWSDDDIESIRTMECLFILIISLTFGGLHISYGIPKVLPSFILGLVLGISFYRYGIVVPVLIHSIYNSFTLLISYWFEDVLLAYLVI